MKSFQRATAALSVMAGFGGDEGAVAAGSAVWIPTYAARVPQGWSAPDEPAAAQGSSPTWATAIDALLRIRNYEDDWDGQGAAAPPGDVVDVAIRFAKACERGEVLPPGLVAASVNGTVVFEYFDSGTYTAIEIDSPHGGERRTVGDGATVAKIEQFTLAFHA